LIAPELAPHPTNIEAGHWPAIFVPEVAARGN